MYSKVHIHSKIICGVIAMVGMGLVGIVATPSGLVAQSKRVIDQSTIDQSTTEPTEQTKEQPKEQPKEQSREVRYTANFLEGKQGSDSNAVAGPYRLLRDSVIFYHNDQVMHCDSARFYAEKDYIEAYGRVHIIDSGYDVYGDNLIYDAVENRVKLREHVRLVGESLTFVSDTLYLNTATHTGHYLDGGTVQFPTQTLTSIAGYYDRDGGVGVFNKEVEVAGDTYSLQTDSLRHYLSSSLTKTYGNTRVWTSDTVYIEAARAVLQEADSIRAERYVFYEGCYYTPSQTLCADSLFSFGAGYKAYGRVQLLRQGTVLLGDAMRYDSVRSVCVGAYRDSVYKQPMLLRYDSLREQMLYVQADTLEMALDSAGFMAGLRAYGSARAVQGDFAVTCDTLAYSAKDSLLRFKHEPVLWNGMAQSSADYISARVVGRKVEKAYLYGEVLVAMPTQQNVESGEEGDGDEGGQPVSHEPYFHQMSGRSAEAYFSNNALDSVYINGNGESIYYAYQGDTLLMGLNRTISGRIQLYFARDSLSRAVFVDKPEGVLYPPDYFTTALQYIEFFAWRIEERFTILEAEQAAQEWLVLRTLPASWEAVKPRRQLRPQRLLLP